ncbi:hypothetical protein K466DRAFT_567757 [Polyporus arcularius HHB13444]|uniref:Uncharacterized protein n=1 Tax=Polyporus arcularius HHB13444 TaxID=1314778 RepID=A0A5C3PCG7_9APHY|nr:hypothetical protein K466DRAFT_567757 [Polyporus arcularius HHB13444]
MTDFSPSTIHPTSSFTHYDDLAAYATNTTPTPDHPPHTVVYPSANTTQPQQYGVPCLAEQSLALSVVGMVLPIDSAMPYYTRIPLLPNPINPMLRPIPNLTGVFNTNSVNIVLHRDYQSSSLQSPLEFHYCPTSFAFDRNLSACVDFIVYRRLPHAPVPLAPRWAGPIVVLKYCDTFCGSYTDVDSSDLQYVQNYLVRQLVQRQ